MGGGEGGGGGGGGGGCGGLRSPIRALDLGLGRLQGRLGISGPWPGLGEKQQIAKGDSVFSVGRREEDV